MKAETINKSFVGVVDDKARRRTNQSCQIANISAREIEGGIDIETLEKINVPVYKYGTQITIHGQLPDVKNDRALGYKAIFKNQNGSIGVKYVAIDGRKKELIVLAYNLAKSTRLGAAISSTGLTLQKRVASNLTAESIEAGRELLTSVPECFTGSKHLCKDMFGCIWAEIDIGSIYWKDLFAFIKWLTYEEIRNEEDISLLKQKREEKRAEEKSKAEEEYKKAVAEKEKKQEEIVKNWENDGFTLYDGPKYDGLYLVRPHPYLKNTFVHSLYKKHGNRFKRSLVESNSRDRISEEYFIKWKNPTDPYTENAKGFMPKG